MTMKLITAAKFCEGVNAIYKEQPTYRIGGDGSDGTCDCIGMPKGALKRAGVDVTGMSGTNYAARHTIKNLQKIKKVEQLRIGDMVLKVRDANDPDIPLPDKYRKGGNDYSSQWSETNFSHIGTVTGINPLEITHMTSPTAKKDTKIGKWVYFGQLPWVEDTGAEETVKGEWARVWAESGSTVKMRAKPSATCRTWWAVPVGSEVILTDPGEKWSGITWAGRSGYMMSKFLRTGDSRYRVTITGLDEKTATEIVNKYGGMITAE